MNRIIRIPSWISTRIYNIDEKSCKAYISNEKAHSYIMLDDLAAKLWQFIYEGKNNQRSILELKKFSQNEDIESELESFLLELESCGLISTGNHIKFEINNAQTVNSEEEKEVENFEEDMYNWFYSHGYIYRLFIQLTFNCNLKCVHCFNKKDNVEKQISFNDLKPVIDEFYKLGLFRITLSGGECTIAKDFLKIAKYIREKRIQLDIYTNGQLLYDNEDLFNEIVKLYPYKISLSLYSMDEKIHDSITGIRGSQKKTVAVIKKLLEKNIHVSIKCFLTSLNADSYIHVTNFAKEIGATIELDCKLIDCPKNYKSTLRATEEQLLEIYSAGNSPLKIRNENFEMDEAFLSQRICRGGLFDMALDPNLNMNICATMDDVVLGNAKKDSISKIWNDKKTDSRYVKFKALRKRDLKGCYKEEYCKYCIYCPGMALMNGKYLQKFERFCDDAKIRMKAAKKGS